ncbi:TIGR03936 family radical SAM-associated protein [Candidatus Poriferisodalis sp.]|uniref:TIGR03936 family radical SAM-associated protein n=1 Tax=Candidatus Poriferisodalis sp. TaxID=3101277 RepID=UPI003B592C22
MAHDALGPDAGAELQCRSHPHGWEMSLRLRVRFSKVGKIRFIGHRDVARVTERAVRKVGLPVAYSQGFSPRMKLSFGLALPTGYESEAEFVELPLVADAVRDGGAAEPGARHAAGPVIVCRGGTHAPCERGLPSTAPSYCTVAGALSEALPVGMEVSAVTLVDGRGPSLQAAVHTCGWQFEIVGLDASAAAKAVADLLAAGTVVTERVHKGETVSSNIRPSVEVLQVVGCSDRGAVLSAELSATPRVVRPSELVPALAPAHEMGIARRTHQWTSGAAGRAEPAVPAMCAQRHKEPISG